MIQKLLSHSVWTCCLPLHKSNTSNYTTATTITTVEFETNGCAASAYYYGRDLMVPSPEYTATWPDTIAYDEIFTFWYNKDCYEKNVALCQKKVPDYDYNFYCY